MSATRSRISISEAAELIGVNPRTIRRMISRGELTGYRLGPRLIRIDPSELEKAGKPIPTAESCGGAR